jgi:hypothetical protein
MRGYAALQLRARSNDSMASDVCSRLIAIIPVESGLRTIPHAESSTQGDRSPIRPAVADDCERLERGKPVRGTGYHPFEERHRTVPACALA